MCEHKPFAVSTTKWEKHIMLILRLVAWKSLRHPQRSIDLDHLAIIVGPNLTLASYAAPQLVSINELAIAMLILKLFVAEGFRERERL